MTKTIFRMSALARRIGSWFFDLEDWLYERGDRRLSPVRASSWTWASPDDEHTPPQHFDHLHGA